LILYANGQKRLQKIALPLPSSLSMPNWNGAVIRFLNWPKN